MTVDRSSNVELTKGAVATRLIKAAIRSFFREDDPLSTYLLSSTAHRLLYDLLEKRGVHPVRSAAAKGALHFAQKIVAGEAYSGPEEGRELIERMVPFVRSGEIKSWQEAEAFFSQGAVGEAIRIIRAPYNFMKHADRDFEAALSEDKFDAESELLIAVSIFEEVFPDANVQEVGLIYYYRQRLAGAGYSPDIQPLADRLDGYELSALKAKINDFLLFMDSHSAN